MNRTGVFEKELEHIQDEGLRAIVRAYMENGCPAYFYEIGASASGKYHPMFSQGEGGLVRHTKAVVMFLDELMKMSTYSYMRQEYKDYAFAAAIIHDSAKYGVGEEIDKTQYAEHASNAAKLFENYCLEHNYVVSPYLLNAVRSHMGQWTTNAEDKPFTSIDRVVHLADYVASRNFINIPELSE